MEYRIKKIERQNRPKYLTPPFATRVDAEKHLEIIVANNTDKEIFYSIVYGQFYAESGGFAEYPEPNK